MGSEGNKSLTFGVIACLVCYIFITTSSCEGQSSVVSEQTGLLRQVVPNQQSTLGEQQWIMRDEAPSSYIFKINSLTSLINEVKDNFQSGVFEAGGYGWRMAFYPKGDRTAGGSDTDVSLYVALEEAEWVAGDVYAEVKLFAYNQKQNKYLMVREEVFVRGRLKVDGITRIAQKPFEGWYSATNTYRGVKSLLPFKEIKKYFRKDGVHVVVVIDEMGQTKYSS